MIKDNVLFNDFSELQTYLSKQENPFDISIIESDDSGKTIFGFTMYKWQDGSLRSESEVALIENFNTVCDEQKESFLSCIIPELNNEEDLEEDMDDDDENDDDTLIDFSVRSSKDLSSETMRRFESITFSDDDSEDF